MTTRWRSLLGTGAMLLALVLIGSGTALGQTPVGPLNGASAPSVSALDHERLLVSWTANDDSSLSPSAVPRAGFEIGYVQHDTAGTFGAAEPHVESVGNNYRQFELTELEAGKRYVVAVRATPGTPADNQDTDATNDVVTKKQDWVATSGMTSAAPKPDAIRARDIRVIAGDTELTIEWGEPYAGKSGLEIVEYFVEWSEKKDGTGMKRWPYPITDRVLTIDRLKNDTTYYVAVGSKNDVGGMTDPSFSTDTRAMGTPTEDMDDMEPLDAPMVTVGTVTHDSVMVSWEAVEGAENYVVNRDTDGGVLVRAEVGGSPTEYNMTGLMPETMYEVWVCAYAEGRMGRLLGGHGRHDDC